MTTGAGERASAQDWLAVFAGALGALIATLDISIVNSALPQIQGEIGATGTEGTWIATGYLVSEVVMIPLSAWLSRLLGMRTLLLTCASLFTLFSVLCGFSNSLAIMIIGRVGQGFFGGALIPTAQTIVRTRLPPAQIPVGMTIFGLIVLLGPLLGAGCRRLADRELELAVVLLHQHPRGHCARHFIADPACPTSRPHSMNCRRRTGSGLRV